MRQTHVDAVEVEGRDQASDAESLLIRPISADDKQALVEAFVRLGEESRYRRFLAPHGQLSDSELRYFTEVDHHDHEALVAIDPETGQVVGVARFVRSRQNQGIGELAVAVVDDWQRQGVGTYLVAALVERARAEGISRFSGLVLAENQLMLSLLAELGRVRVIHREHGTVELTVDLPETGRMLRAVARAEVTPLPVEVRES